jgi:hypothetical protein
MTIESIGDPTRVRIATQADVDELFDVLTEMHAEQFVLPMDGPKVRDVLINATLPAIEKRRGIIGVIGQPGRLEGSIGLMLERTWYSSDLCLWDAWQYVKPEYRSTTGSKDMIAWAKGISDHFQVPLMVGIVSSERTQAKVRLLRRQMGDPVGAFFMYSKAAGAR